MRITNQVLKKVGELSKQYSNFPDAYIKRSMEQVSKITIPATVNVHHQNNHLRYTGEHLEENRIIFQGQWNAINSVLQQIVHGLVNSDNRICPVQSGRRCSWNR